MADLPVVLQCPQCHERSPRIQKLSQDGDYSECLEFTLVCAKCKTASMWRGTVAGAIWQTKRHGHIRCQT